MRSRLRQLGIPTPWLDFSLPSQHGADRFTFHASPSTPTGPGIVHRLARRFGQCYQPQRLRELWPRIIALSFDGSCMILALSTTNSRGRHRGAVLDDISHWMISATGLKSIIFIWRVSPLTTHERHLARHQSKLAKCYAVYNTSKHPLAKAVHIANLLLRR
jgi:hypothetical protein